MRIHATVSLVGAMSLSGCFERPGAGVTLMQPRPAHELSPIEVGSPRELDRPVNPMEGVRVIACDDAVVVRFAPPRGPAEVERLDPGTLEVVSSARETADRGSPPLPQALRVSVDSGRHVIALWKTGDSERGYRVMAQAFDANDNRLGAAVQVSPPGADVSGPLSAATCDGTDVVATFAASTGDDRAFAAYAVPLRAF